MKNLFMSVAVALALCVGIIAASPSGASAAPAPCVAQATLNASVGGYIQKYELVRATVSTNDYACKLTHPAPMTVTFTPRADTTFKAISQTPAGWTCAAPAVGSTDPVVCTRAANMPQGTISNFGVQFNMPSYPGPQRPAPQAQVCLETPLTSKCVEAYRIAGT